MKKLMTATIAALGAFMLFGAGPVIPLDKSVIVLQSVPDGAKELQTHFAFMTGIEAKKIPILNDEAKAPAGAYVWHVGIAPDGKKAKDLLPEEGKWKITEKGAWVWGGPLRGDVKGVYDMLEAAFGIRWPWPGAIAGPQGVTNFEVLASEGGWQAPFKIRTVRMANTKDATDWRLRMRYGKQGKINYGHAFSRYWERFGWNKKHPEYFAMRKDGQRMPIGVANDTAYNVAASQDKPARYISMCVSSEAFVDQIIADWQASGAPEYINLCENDASGDNICWCENCRKLDEPAEEHIGRFGAEWWPVWYADRYVNFAHRVLAKAKKIRPDVKATMYAYNAMEYPPRRERLTDDIVIGIVPTVFTKEAIHDFIAGWKKAGMTTFFHRPNRRCYYSPNMLPIGFEKHFYDIFRIIYDAGGCIGFDHDGGTPQVPTGAFSDYVTCKTMVDPTKSFEYWEDHYMTAFGAAKEQVRAYYRYWREEVWEKRLEKDIARITEAGLAFNFTRGLYWNLSHYYHTDDFAKAGAFLDAARRNPALTPNAKSLVDTLWERHEYAQLWAAAIVEMSDDNVKALCDYRIAHHLHATGGTGETTGMFDLTGSFRYLPKPPANCRAPTKDLLIVDMGYPVAAAELKKHLDLHLGADVPIVKGEENAPTNTFNLFVGRVPHEASPHLVDFQPPEEGYWVFPNKGRKRRGYFYGPTPDAVENATRDFCEYSLGARWLWPGEIAIKQRDQLYLYTWKNAWHPEARLVKRAIAVPGEGGEEFARRIRLGSHKSTGAVKTFTIGEEAFAPGGEMAAFDAWQKMWSENKGNLAFEYKAPKGVFAAHTAYILARAMSRPLMTFEYWENHYLQGFGAASREMHRYYAALRAAYAAAGKVDAAAFAAASKHLDDALARPDLLPEDRARVERVKAEAKVCAN